MSDYTITENFTKINCDGNGNIIFTQNGELLSVTSNQPINLSVKNNELVIKSKSGGNISFGGGSFNLSNFSNISNVNSFNMSNNSDTIIINGVEYVPKNTKEPTDKEYSKNWMISMLPKVSCVNLKGSGDITFESTILLSQSSITLFGSGDINIANENFETLNVHLSGSGDINLGGSTIANINISLNGSGDISNFYALKTCHVGIVGSGDVRGSASNKCELYKNKVGNGSVKIKII